MVLVMINDERYSGSTTMLKQITGGDILKARMKNIQGTFDFYLNGNVLIIANPSLNQLRLNRSS
jgi:phage/plasmid-associated DNA primase